MSQVMSGTILQVVTIGEPRKTKVDCWQLIK